MPVSPVKLSKRRAVVWYGFQMTTSGRSPSNWGGKRRDGLTHRLETLAAIRTVGREAGRDLLLERYLRGWFCVEEFMIKGVGATVTGQERNGLAGESGIEELSGFSSGSAAARQERSGRPVTMIDALMWPTNQSRNQNWRSQPLTLISPDNCIPASRFWA